MIKSVLKVTLVCNICGAESETNWDLNEYPRLPDITELRGTNLGWSVVNGKHIFCPECVKKINQSIDEI